MLSRRHRPRASNEHVNTAAPPRSYPPATEPGSPVAVGVGPIGPVALVDVARHGRPVQLTDDALAAMAASRAVIDALAGDSAPHYGISTGFGALATTHITADRRAALQTSLIRSHAAGTGAPVEVEVVRGMMLLRLSTLATGRTGIRPATAQAYAALLNAGITPVVPEYGSLGCSGDLAPLAAADLAELLDGADISAAMSVEALLGTDRVFAVALHRLRPQVGQSVSAARMATALAGSPIVASHAGPEDTRVQDAYSLRCTPAVHGTARDTLGHALTIADRELASAIDNPVVLPDGSVESNGNFHGAPVAAVLDFLAISVADVANIAERRTDRMLDPHRSHGLPPFLAHEVGVDSGHMIAQYTQAGIVAELKRLAVPASVDSIPSSAMQEDHVSLGWHAGRKLRRAVDGLRRVLAVEILTAARALDFRSPLQPGVVTGAARAAVRTVVDGPGPDRHLGPEIDAVVELLSGGRFSAAVEPLIDSTPRTDSTPHLDTRPDRSAR